MRIFLISLIAKMTAFVCRFFKVGAGVTWPGEISLRLDDQILKKLSRGLKKGIILVAGTNGKTTTASMIGHILQSQGYQIIHNSTGANLRNGICGTLILKTDFFGRITADYAILETDEATFGQLVKEINPQVVVLLNLFRDQLDRYGEVNTIAKKWHEALVKLPSSATVILNADDPQVAFLGEKLTAQVRHVGMEKTGLKTGVQGEMWGDSLYCPSCGARLFYLSHVFSHLGNWVCRSCGLKRPNIDVDASEIKLPIDGLHNQYNAAAAVLAASFVTKQPVNALFPKLAGFTPAFGRMETFTLPNEQNSRVQILLSKNPTGLNENIRLLSTLNDVGCVLLVLNDRIPDGTDVSWIWDVDMQQLAKFATIIVSGDRAHDLALRFKYQRLKEVKTESDLKKAIQVGLANTQKDKTFYILPTYSAMLDVRNILLGRKIL